MPSVPALPVPAGTPSKHILLQKENLVTHDKTWLPARLQPPRLTEEKLYPDYLAEYEQYLVALQHMKAVFLATRRADESKKLIPPVVYGTALRKGYNPATQSMTYRTYPNLRFGTIPPVTEFDEHRMARGSSLPQPEVLPSFFEIPQVATTKNVVTPELKKARRKAKKQRAAARRAARKSSPSDQIKAEAAKVEAKVRLVSAQAALAKVSTKAKRLSPGEARRRAKRRSRRAEERKARATPSGGPE
jgi:hypothetical protein